MGCCADAGRVYVGVVFVGGVMLVGSMMLVEMKPGVVVWCWQVV